MAPRTRQQSTGTVQPKLEELPGTKNPRGRKRKAAPVAESAVQKEKNGNTDYLQTTDSARPSTSPDQDHAEQPSTKLADNAAELNNIAEAQQKADVAHQLKSQTHQPTLESMKHVEGNPGPPKTAPDSGQALHQAGSQRKQEDVRKVDNPEVQVNRAPVITLWAATVAQRQGFSRECALTFGKYISGMLAQSKGRAIGIYEDSSATDAERAEAQQKEQEAGIEHVDVFGMTVKAVKVKGELRAAEANNRAANPKATEGYLQRAFGHRLADVEGVFKELAESLDPEEAAASGYKLYERFRPSVPQGQRGWGAKGVLDLQYVLSLSRSQ